MNDAENFVLARRQHFYKTVIFTSVIARSSHPRS